MSRKSTYTSPSLAHICSNRPADSTRITSYIRRQYVRTVPNVDIVGSSKCHTRHLATGGVACFNYVLATNWNPFTTCASDGRVNPYPNTATYGFIAPFLFLLSIASHRYHITTVVETIRGFIRFFDPAGHALSVNITLEFWLNARHTVRKSK